LLISDIEKDIKNISSLLKQELDVSLNEAFEPLFSSCDKIVEKYEHGALTPKDKELYQAVYLYLKGKISEDIEYLYDILAYGLYLPIEMLDNRYIAGDKDKLNNLLNRYSFEAYNGDLLKETWRAVFKAYYEPEVKMPEQEIMRVFLSETFQYMIESTDYKPQWLEVIKKHQGLLGKDPCREFAEEYFIGDTADIKTVLKSLQISDKSWFWQEMMKASIKFLSNKPDDEFIIFIPEMLFMLEQFPQAADEALSMMLSRYNQCVDVDKRKHRELKDFAIKLWKNPKLRYSGISKWLIVSEAVWQMVIGWVNEEYLNVFFETISARYDDEKPRIKAWLKYVEWIRFTSSLLENPDKGKDLELIRLFVMEESVAQYEDEMQNQKLDIFINRIDKYLVQI